MTEAEARRASAPVRWGIGHAVVALVVAIVVASSLAALVILGGDYYTGPWSEVGAAAGWSNGVAAAGGELTAPKLTPLWLLLVLQIPQWSLLLAAAYAATRLLGGGMRRDLLLQARPADAAIGFAAGAVTQFVLIPLLYALLFIFIGEQDISSEARRVTDLASGPSIALLIILTVIGAPLVEEIFFRGFFMGAFDRRFGRATAVIVSSLVFGLVHFQPLQFPALVMFGVVAALLVYRFQRLGPAIFAHVAFNLSAVVALLANR